MKRKRYEGVLAQFWARPGGFAWKSCETTVWNSNDQHCLARSNNIMKQLFTEKSVNFSEDKQEPEAVAVTIAVQPFSMHVAHDGHCEVSK